MRTTLENLSTTLSRIDCEHSANDVLARRACRILEASPYFHGRVGSLQLQATGDKLVVKGRVPSFFLKQILQTLLAQVDGVGQIENRVDVTSPQGVG